jgi:hypothetical protein
MFVYVKHDRGLQDSFMYVLLLSLLSTVLSIAIGFARGVELSLVSGFGILAVSVLFVIAMTFIASAVLHLFVYAAKGRGGYANTFRSVVYSQTPYHAIGWLPVGLAGLLPGIAFTLLIFAWMVAVAVKGITILHEISPGRAAAAVLVPSIASLAAAVLLFAPASGL